MTDLLNYLLKRVFYLFEVLHSLKIHNVGKKALDFLFILN